MGKNLTGHKKQALQRDAKARLGRLGFRELCLKAGRRLGVTWDGTKGHAYVLFKRVCLELPLLPSSQLVRTPRPASTASGIDVNSDAFLSGYAWRVLRMRVLTKFGARCQCCGATARDGVRIHVDHIKPRRKYPDLALVESNLQVLCEVCNHGKGNWDESDWRPDDYTDHAPCWTPPTKPRIQ